MNDNAAQDVVNEMAAFHKLWLDSLSKTMQAASPLSPGATSPEVLRQIRSGNFEALAKWWAEAMRSPQSLGGMKQWMDNAANFRKVTQEFLANVRHDLQAPSHDDVDTLMLTVRHMEKRLLDRIEEVSNTASRLHQLSAKRAANSVAATRQSAAERSGRWRRSAETPLRRRSKRSSPKTKSSPYTGSERAEFDTVEHNKGAKTPL